MDQYGTILRKLDKETNSGAFDKVLVKKLKEGEKDIILHLEKIFSKEQVSHYKSLLPIDRLYDDDLPF